MKTFRTLAAAGLLTVAGATPVLAQTACSDATVSGAYAAHGQGWIGSADLLSPEVVVANRIFTGRGTFSGGGHQSIAGVGRWFKTTGSYKVGPGCDITLDATSTTDGVTPPANPEVSHWFGVVTAAGNTIFVTRTDKGYTTTTEFDRVLPTY